MKPSDRVAVIATALWIGLVAGLGSATAHATGQFYGATWGDESVKWKFTEGFPKATRRHRATALAQVPDLRRSSTRASMVLSFRWTPDEDARASLRLHPIAS